MENKEVSWHILVAMNLEDVSNPEVLPLLLDEHAVVEAERLLLVLLPVALMPFVIFIGVLDHGYSDHDRQRDGHHRFAVRDRDRLDCLHERNYQEVNIGKLLELVQQVQRDESKHIVLGGPHHVASHLLVGRNVGCPFLVKQYLTLI